MTGDKQRQKAGDNSQQIQANTIVINQGIDEKRAREICAETFEIAKRDFTQEAITCATERVTQLENRIMTRMLPIEGAINSFSDPAFQVLLSNAQRTAVATEREMDYDMLTELLICHIEKGKARKTRTGISKAVEIIDKIDDDALCALTVFHAVECFTPNASTSKTGIKILADMFEKLIYTELPSGIDWIEHLDILGTIRINPLINFDKIEKIYHRTLDGYSKAGIKVDSEYYKKAIELLSSINISPTFLIQNEFLGNYVKLPIINKKSIKSLIITRPVNLRGQIKNINNPITEREVEVFEAIYDLYTTDKDVNKKSEDAFINEWDSYKSLKTLCDWWNNIPCAFNITHVGKVLAHTNAQRCDNTIPELSLNI